VKAGKASKKIAWHGSRHFRRVAQWQFSWGMKTYDILRDKHDRPILSQCNRDLLQKVFAETSAERERRRDPEVQKAANLQRLVQKHKLMQTRRPKVQAYGDNDDGELEMTSYIMPPEKGLNLNVFGFTNPGLYCHLGALLACLPFARAISEVASPAPLCRALKSVIFPSAPRQVPVSFQLVIAALSAHFPDPFDGVRFFTEMQDPMEYLQLLFDGLISQNHHFAELTTASVTAENGATTFIEAVRIAREHHVTDLENRHIYGRMDSGLVSSWPIILILSIEYSDLGQPGCIVSLPRRIQVKSRPDFCL
jgi:hypothetical protein